MRTALAVALMALWAATGVHAQGSADWTSLAVIQEVKHWTYSNYTRVVVYADRRIEFQTQELPADPAHQKPPRIYVDFKGARIAPSVGSELKIDDGLLTRARIAQFDKERARLVLDLESVAEYQVVPFRDPFRLVIDVRGEHKKPTPTPLAQIKTAEPRPSPSGDAIADLLGGASAVVVKPPARAQHTVVIDAGHGGKDPGAIGARGVYEKDLVLSVAKLVGENLRQRGHKVILTRDRDVYLTLEERTGIANGNNADLFVSIHANSAPTPDAYGIETYHLAPATDRRAAQVAARENAISPEEADALEELLAALRFSSRLGVSSVLAQFVQNSIADVLRPRFPRGFKDLGVKGAPFYVLVGTDMAAILVEIGFVSNHDEARRLRDPGYQKFLADGISSGIEQYLQKAGKIPI